jgi:hypothetical protein
MSSGAFAPAAAELPKCHFSYGRGWSCHRASVATSENHRTSLDTIAAEGNWWVGWIEEVLDINCQERSFEEWKQVLEVTLKEAPQFSRQGALVAAGSGYTEEEITP